MYTTTKYNWINNNIIFEIKDTLNLKVLLESNNILLSSSRFDTMNYQIFDLLNVKNTDITTQDLRVFFTLHGKAMKWNRTVKTAIVSSEPKIVSYFNIVLKEMAGLNCKVFDTLYDALDWCKTKNKVQ